MNAQLIWKENMHFVCTNGEHSVAMDATTDHGGTGKGPTPKELILDAMMGCTAIDVVSILKKTRQEISEFKMNIEAEKNTEHPVHFKTAKLNFYLQGKIETEKAIKAVDSSLTKYCGVNYMISKTCHITYEIWVNNSSIKQGLVSFIDPKN